MDIAVWNLTNSSTKVILQLKSKHLMLCGSISELFQRTSNVKKKALTQYTWANITLASSMTEVNATI